MRHRCQTHQLEREEVDSAIFGGVVVPGIKMRILVDITHPAYVHFFRPILPKLEESGHQVLVTSRDKDVTIDLLDAFGVTHRPLSRAGNSLWMRAFEMVQRKRRLCRVIEAFRPDVVLARDGLFACQAAYRSGVPSISFDDTDDAPIQHRLYFPFAWRVYTDRAYRKRIGSNQRFYTGVSCLAYLHPRVFQPDPEVLRAFGVDPGDRFIIVRLVQWTANHDILKRGFRKGSLRFLLGELSKYGRVFLSSEKALSSDLEPYRIPLPNDQIHHLMAFSSLYLGESATMAAECAVLGVPAIHLSTRTLWYTEELAEKYQLVINLRDEGEALVHAKTLLEDENALRRAQERRDQYLEETDDFWCVIRQALDEVKSK